MGLVSDFKALSLKYGNSDDPSTKLYQFYFIHTDCSAFASVYAKDTRELCSIIVTQRYYPGCGPSEVIATGGRGLSSFNIDTKAICCFSLELLEQYRRLMRQSAISQMVYIRGILRMYGSVHEIYNFQFFKPMQIID
jgi:hypothetical protein